MTTDDMNVAMSGGQVQGVIGVHTVHIENFTIYNRVAEEPVASAAGGAEIPPCPYPGLAYFGPDDAAIFFGRGTVIERLTEAVARQSLTALVGASGSGKSSVVLAGLAPRLHEGGNWLFSYFRIGYEPDHDPFMALARALVPFYVTSTDETERLVNAKKLGANLRSGELALGDVFGACRSQNKGNRILLIADQFEEVFTLVHDEAIRNRFIDLLLAGFPDPALGTAPHFCLVITLRADFYGNALLYRPLVDALDGRVENLGPMNRDELKSAIVSPTEGAKVLFQPGLVETLLDEVERRPGTLPLLQFALREMWGLQEDGTLTRASYDSIGGVQGALARRAEKIYVKLTDNATNRIMEKDFQRLFTRLVTPGEGQEDTRRVAQREELGSEVWSLAQRLASEGNRLVVTNAPELSHETAEVVHEALIRHWPRLARWIDQDRSFLSWLRQIKGNVELWVADPSDEGTLLRGGMLARAEDWLTTRRDDLSSTEREYIEASLALRRHAEEEKEAAQQAEIRRQQELAEAAEQLRREAEARALAEAQARSAADAAARAAERRTEVETQARSAAEVARSKARRLAIYIGAALAITVIALVVAGWQAEEARRQQAIAERQKDLALVATTAMNRVSGAAFPKAMELADVTLDAVRSGSVDNEVNAYVELGLFSYESAERSEANKALGSAARIIPQAVDPSTVARYHEVLGDIEWSEPNETFDSSISEYGTASNILANAAADSRSRLLRKTAAALMTRGQLDEAETTLNEASTLLSIAPRSLEHGFVALVRGQIDIARHDPSSALVNLRRAIDFLKNSPELSKSLPARLALGEALELLGDVEYNRDASRSYIAYAEAAKSLDSFLADYPTSLDAQLSMEFARLGLRRLSMTNRYDAARQADIENARAKFDTLFGSGIGKFRYGMSKSEVNQIFEVPFDETGFSKLPRAWEYKTEDVRYFCRYLGSQPPPGVGCGAGMRSGDLIQGAIPGWSDCMRESAYVVFMFADDRLFRLAIRFVGNKAACREELQRSVDNFAKTYEIAVSGAGSERRLRYETNQVVLVAKSDGNGVVYEFVQR